MPSAPPAPEPPGPPTLSNGDDLYEWTDQFILLMSLILPLEGGPKPEERKQGGVSPTREVRASLIGGECGVEDPT